MSAGEYLLLILAATGCYMLILQVAELVAEVFI